MFDVYGIRSRVAKTGRKLMLTGAGGGLVGGGSGVIFGCWGDPDPSGPLAISAYVFLYCLILPTMSLFLIKFRHILTKKITDYITVLGGKK